MEVSGKDIKRIQWKLRLLGWFKIPMIGFIRPRLISFSEEKLTVQVRLTRRTKNHLNSMYFGALAVGADLAAGIHVFYFSEKLGKRVSFAFKGMSGDFLMRTESDATFTISEGLKIKALVEESSRTGERVNHPIQVKVTDLEGNHVAQLEMIISLKVKA